MELRQIRYFVTLAEKLNFSRASELLYITQPTLSQQISNLERELGCELFVRSRRSVELSNVGRAILPAAKEMLALEEHLQKLVADAVSYQPSRFPLMIGIEKKLLSWEHVVTAYLSTMEKLQDYRITLMDVDLLQDSRSQLLEMLQNRKVDLIITLEPGTREESRTKESRVLYQDRMCVLVAEEQIRKHGGRNNQNLIRELMLDGRVFFFDDMYIEQTQVFKLASSLGIEPNLCFLYEKSISRMRVCAKQGVIIQSELACQEMRNEMLDTIPINMEDGELDILASWNKGEVHPALPMVVETMRQMLAKGENQRPDRMS